MRQSCARPAQVHALGAGHLINRFEHSAAWERGCQGAGRALALRLDLGAVRGPAGAALRHALGEIVEDFRRLEGHLGRRARIPVSAARRRSLSMRQQPRVALRSIALYY